MERLMVGAARGRGLAPPASALALFLLAAGMLGGNALRGRHALGPDALLDNEGMYALREPPKLETNSDVTPIVADLPRDARFSRGLRHGRIDTWNPLSGLGAPLWAEQGGPLFPLKLPYYLVPHITAWDVFRLLRLVCAALGVWLLARRRGLSPVAATAAGLAFELSGAMVSQVSFGSSSPLCLMPWAVAGADAIARGPSRSAVAGSAIALGIAGSGGHPSLILLVFVAFTVVIAGHAIRQCRTPRRALAIAGAGAGAALLGLALGAPFSLPLRELVAVADSYKDGPRAEGVWTEWLGKTRKMLWTGAFVPEAVVASRTDQVTEVPFGVSSSLGGAALVLAVAGILGGALDAGLLACMVVGIGLVLAPRGLGWLHSLPGLRLVLPHYAWPLVTLPLAVTCGHGVGLLDEGVDGRRGVRARWAAPLALLLVAVLFAALMWKPGWSPELRDAVHRVMGSAARRSVRLSLVAALLAGIAPLALAGTRWARPLSLVLLVAIGYPPIRSLSTMLRDPPSLSLRRPPSPGLEVIRTQLSRGGRMLGLPLAIGYPNTPLLYDIADLRILAALPDKRLRTYFGLIGPLPPLLTTHTPSKLRSPLIDLADVRLLVRPRGGPRWPVHDTSDGDDQTRLVYSDTYLVLYRNLAATGRAFVVHDVVRANSMERAAWWLAPFAARAEHAREVGLLERAVIEAPAQADIPLAEPPEGAHESVEVTSDADPQRLVLDARLGADGMVVVADAFHPGWSATVDGKPVTIYAADVALRAVPVPAGSHRIVMEYHSAGFRNGLLIAGVALLVIGLLLRRRSPTAARNRGGVPD